MNKIKYVSHYNIIYILSGFLLLSLVSRVTLVSSTSPVDRGFVDVLDNLLQVLVGGRVMVALRDFVQVV